MLCPSDTPDGGKIGHVNHLAIAARCSFKVETSKIYGKILEINKEMNENIKRVKRDTVKKQSKLRQSIAEYVSKEKETMQQEEAAEAAAAANGGEIPKLTKSDDTQQQQQHEKQEKAEVKYANTVYHNYEASQNVIINYHEKTDLTYCIFTKEDLKLFLPESKIDKVFAQNRMNFINSLCSGK